MPYGHKEWLAEYDGHSIRVVNSWFGGAKLYIDGDIRDSTNALFAVGEKLLSAKINDKGDIVEIIIHATFSTKVKILVNDYQIGGDKF